MALHTYTLFNLLNHTKMAFTLPDLPYAFDALEPHIDARTMEIHHDKHHAGYTNKLNAAIEGTALAGQSIDDILKELDMSNTAVRNNGGGYYNHNLFWTVMAPNGGGQPSGDLADAINAAYGSFDGFKDALLEGCCHTLRFRLGMALCTSGRSCRGLLQC